MGGTVSFVGVVTEHQAFLGGTDEYAIDAESVESRDGATSWQATLDLRWPRAAGGPVEEAGLILTSGEGDEISGSFVAGTATIHIDEDTGAERLAFSLRFVIVGSDVGGEAQQMSDTGEIDGELDGDDVRFVLRFGSSKRGGRRSAPAG